MKFSLVVGVTLAWSGWAWAAEIQKDIPYAAPGGAPLLLDARVPDGPGPFPAVVIVHGGGWIGGDKADPKEVQPILDPLTAGGIAWFSVNYRLAGQARYPACVEDVEAAVQFVKTHARDYRVDPDKVALSGDSAGGHIVDMVAVRATPDKPERQLAAVVCFYGPNDLVEDSFRRNVVSPGLQAVFGIRAGPLDTAAVKRLQAASPIASVSPSLPPFLLLHGTADQSVDYPVSVIWKEALDALGVPCELITIPQGVHVMGNWDRMDPPQTAYKQQFVAWLQQAFANAGTARAPAKSAGVPATKDRVTGWWRQTRVPAGAAIHLVADGTGESMVAPVCNLTWSFDPATALVHIEYPAGQGREVPYAGSPDLKPSARDKIANAGPRPRVTFADLRYFPEPDLFLSSNGEIFRRCLQ